MANHGLSPEELAMLTDEEREGLEADEEEEDEDEQQEEQQPGEEEEEEQDGDKPASDKDKPAEQQEEQQPGEQEEQEEEKPEPKRTRVEMFKAEVPEDIDARRASLDTRWDELAAKFDDGDITFAEYNKGIRELNDERSKLDRLELKAELAREANQSRTQEDWANLCTDFVSDNPLIAKNETLWNAFDRKLRQVTAATMEAGGQPGRRDLEKAYKLMQEDLGLAPQEAKQTEQPAKKTKKAVEVPPTLGKVPASQQMDTEDGKYAHLDRLAETDPEKYEAALLKMSDAERDAYMQAG